MTSVLVIGAGATVSQAQSYRPQQTREHPPLDLNFFQKASELTGMHPQVEEEIERFQRRIEEGEDYFDPFEGPSVSLEQFFADVYYEVSSRREELHLKVFRDLLRLYNRVIGVTTNWIVDRDRLGALDRVLRKESNLADGDLTVVTFNQDLLIENRALNFPYWDESWCLRSIYGDPQLTELPGGKESFAEHNGDCDHHPPFTLLKLHGSLNWAIRSKSRNPNASVLFPEEPEEIFLLNTRQVYLGSRLRDSKTDERWWLWPLVVPPIYAKHRVAGIGVIQSLWQQARKEIESADRLLLYGYSVPEADVTAAQMLRRAISLNEGLDCVDCINPDASLAKKLQDRLGVKVIRLYEDADSYLEHAR